MIHNNAVFPEKGKVLIFFWRQTRQDEAKKSYMNTFIHRGYIQLSKSDSKDIYNVTNYLYFK